MDNPPASSARTSLVLVFGLLLLGGLVIFYLVGRRQPSLAIPRVDELTRLHVHIDGALPGQELNVTPRFDVPSAYFQAIVGPFNTATAIRRPATVSSIGRVEAWYSDGQSTRLDLFLMATKDASLKSKNLVFSTPAGDWREAGNYLEFSDQLQKAYRESKASSLPAAQ